MSNNNNLIYNIDLNKFKLLGNISPDFIEFVIDDIFNLGYNTWVKNFIKNDPNILTNLNQNQYQNQTDNNITDSKLTSKGQSGENIVLDILKDKFPDFQIENTSKFAHHGDIQVTTTNKIKIIVEVKNYNKTVDQEQIDKLKFDMKFTNINLAILISLNSGIVGRKRFEIESFYFNKTFNYIIHIPYSMHKVIPNKKYMITHNSIDDSIYNLMIKIEYSISIISSIGENLLSNKNKQNNISDKNIDVLIQNLEKFYDEFKIVKYSCIKLEENIKKSLDSHLTIIKDYESNIKSNINNLITKKFNQNIINFNNDNKIIKPIINIINVNINKDKDKDKDKDNINYLNQEIYLNELLIGKIIQINKTFDLLIHYQKQIINEFFTEYDDCIGFLNSIL
jgi:hypothetical protein